MNTLFDSERHFKEGGNCEEGGEPIQDSRPDPKGIIAFAYNDNGRPVSMTDVGGITTGYDYDDAGKLIQVSRTDTVWGYSYDDDGKLTQCSMSCGVISDYTYDVESRLIRIMHSKDEDILYQVDYEFDKAGNIIARAISSTGGVQSEEYFYDALYRLVWTEENNVMRAEYEYDPAGNRLRKIASDNTTRYDYDAADEMVRAGGERCYYDRDGNMIERRDPGGEDWNYEWDAAGRLMRASSTGSGPIRYYYDHDNLRTRKEIGASGTNYYWVPGDILGLPYIINEKDGGGSMTASYVLSPYGTLGIKAGGDSRFYLTDALGSVLALADLSGTITDTYEYDEFGIITSSSGTFYNPVRFANYFYDFETEMYYLRARYYDARTGRFISRDPSSFENNRYAYVNGDPINMVDPSGKQAMCFYYMGRIAPHINDMRIFVQDWESRCGERLVQVPGRDPYYALADLYLYNVTGIPDLLERYLNSCGHAAVPWRQPQR